MSVLNNWPVIDIATEANENTIKSLEGKSLDKLFSDYLAGWAN